MEKAKKATKGQRERVLNMLASGLIDGEEARAIIRKHRVEPKARKTQKTKDRERLAFWEERFPGKGAALMEILRPFYDWKPELKPAIPRLEARAKRAVFWKEYQVRRIYPASFGTVHFASLVAPFGDSFWTIHIDSLWTPLEDSLSYARADSHGANHAISLRCSLLSLLHTACVYVLTVEPEKAARFKPLLELWLAGNFPAGFDADGNLLVLVAENR